MVPECIIRVFLPQNRPELHAAGTTGTSRFVYNAEMPADWNVMGWSIACRVPCGNNSALRPSPTARRASSTIWRSAWRPAERSTRIIGYRSRNQPTSGSFRSSFLATMLASGKITQSAAVSHSD